MDLSTTPIIFLDIDGVLQPFSSEKRFDIDRIEYRKWAEKCFSKDELSRKRITLKEREIEILLFLQEHKVKRYIALDDIDLYIALGRRAVTVTNHDEFFNRRCLDLALSVL